MAVRKIFYVKVYFEGFLSNAPQERCYKTVGSAVEYAEKCLETRVKELLGCKDLPRRIIHDTGSYYTISGCFRLLVLGNSARCSIESLGYKVIYRTLVLH